MNKFCEDNLDAFEIKTPPNSKSKKVEESPEQNAAADEISNEEIKKLLAKKSKVFMSVLAKHGVKPWELQFETK